MAFLRSYSYQQGDPLLWSQLNRAFRQANALRPSGGFRKRGAPQQLIPLRPGVAAAMERRGRTPIITTMQGDPFFGGIGKFFKKAAKAVKKFQPGKFIAKAAPIAAAFIPGVGGLLGAGLAAALPQGVTSLPPEPVPTPEPTGPVGEVVAVGRDAENAQLNAFFATLSERQLRDLAAALGVSV